MINNAWVIGRQSTAADAAWEWIKWHSLLDQQVLRASSGTGLPMRQGRRAGGQPGPGPAREPARLPAQPGVRRDAGGERRVAGWRTVAQDELLKAFRKEVPLVNALQEANRLAQAELDKFYKKS